MNIIHNLPKRFIELSGVSMRIVQTIHGDSFLDVETGMKSHMHIHYEYEEYIARMRYEGFSRLKTFGDFVSALRYCEHGKGFMNMAWLDIYTNGFGEFDNERFE